MIPNWNYLGQQFRKIFFRNNFYKIAKQFEKKIWTLIFLLCQVKESIY